MSIKPRSHSQASTNSSPFSKWRLKQMKAKLQRGASQAERGELLEADEVFKELKQLIQERRRAKKKATRA